jgi:hypothetical protein
VPGREEDMNSRIFSIILRVYVQLVSCQCAVNVIQVRKK